MALLLLGEDIERIVNRPTEYLKDKEQELKRRGGRGGGLPRPSESPKTFYQIEMHSFNPLQSLLVSLPPIFCDSSPFFILGKIDSETKHNSKKRKERKEKKRYVFCFCCVLLWHQRHHFGKKKKETIDRCARLPPSPAPCAQTPWHVFHRLVLYKTNRCEPTCNNKKKTATIVKKWMNECKGVAYVRPGERRNVILPIACCYCVPYIISSGVVEIIRRTRQRRRCNEIRLYGRMDVLYVRHRLAAVGGGWFSLFRSLRRSLRRSPFSWLDDATHQSLEFVEHVEQRQGK